MEPPTDVRGVRRFLGMVTHVARFLPHISEVTAPIRELLNKRSARVWGPAQQAAFAQVKALLPSERCMANYHPSYPTTASADTSSFCLGAVLLQDQPAGEQRAVTFASRALTPTERRYGQTEKEVLATTGAARRFDEFVRDLHFSIEPDHQSLVSLFRKMDLDLLPPTVQRLRMKLMQYQFRRLYPPGKLLATAGTLSRGLPSGDSPRKKGDTVDAIEGFAVAAV